MSNPALKELKILLLEIKNITAVFFSHLVFKIQKNGSD